MRGSAKIVASALALATGILLFDAKASAGEFKNLTAIPNASCVNVHSSPLNVNSAMAMEVFEFTAPAADGYRCCIQQNSTGRGLFVRLIGLTGSPLASALTAINGGGCTGFINLGAPFAFQCTVASGAGAPIVANGHYILGACRQ